MDETDHVDFIVIPKERQEEFLSNYQLFKTSLDAKTLCTFERSKYEENKERYDEMVTNTFNAYCEAMDSALLGQTVGGEEDGEEG